MIEHLVIHVETMGDIDDLESAQSVKSLLDWMEKHTAVPRETLREIPVSELQALVKKIKDEIVKAFDIPKATSGLS